MQRALFYCLLILAAGGPGHAGDKLPGQHTAPYAERKLHLPFSTRNGMDFWRDDRLNLIRPSSGRNLLNNPSFESGLRYYTFPSDIGTYIPGYEDKYSIDNREFHRGKASLRILAIAPPGSFDMLQSFAYPLRKNQVYTLSFYAKAARPGVPLEIRHIPANTNRRDELPETSNSRFILTRHWQRYSIRINSRSSGYSFAFSVKDQPGHPAVWIDDVQLEEGDTATELNESSLVGMELITSRPDNFLTPGEKINAVLRLRNLPPNAAGSLQVAIEDFFYNVIDLPKQNFSTDAAGNAAVVLPLDALLAGKTGIWLLLVRIEMKNPPASFADFFRLSIMHKLKNTHRNREMAGYHQLVIPNYEAAMARWRDIGIGSTNYFYYNFHNRVLFDLLKKYGISDTCMPLRQHWNVTLPDKTLIPRNDAISIQPNGAADQNARVLISGWRSWHSVTPEQIAQFERAAEAVARYYHWRHNFALDHEMYNYMLENGRYEDFVRILIACARGVKRADPANQVYLEGGAANVMMGIALTENLLTAAEKVDPQFRFDRFAVHAYGHPEHEEFDDLLTRYVEVLNRHGYERAPVYVNEGGYYSPYVIPEWNLTPYRPLLMDHYHLWAPSYDMGWGERISAALTVRAWLLGLKHQDRIKQFNVWRPFIYLDTQLTPMAVQKGVNTLMRLLGNATFRKEIVFAPTCRSYLFETDDGIPIAAIWSFEESVESGKVRPGIARAKDPGLELEIVDFMENTTKVSAKAALLELPLSPFPLFLRAERGKLSELAALVNRLSADEQEESPPIHVSGHLSSCSRFQLEIKNLLTREFRGTLEVSCGNFRTVTPLQLASLARLTKEIPLSTAAVAGEIRGMTVKWLATAEDGTRYQQNIPLHCFAIMETATPLPPGGKDAAWKNIPWLPVESFRGNRKDPRPFSVRFRTAWDAQNLYLQVDVTDSVLFYGAPFRNSAQATDCDVLIVYIDPLANGKQKKTLRVDSDDYYYVFMPRPNEGKMLVFTQEACNQQLSLGVNSIQPRVYVNEIPTRFSKTAQGYRYEIAFPQKALLPATLKSGSVFGLGMLIRNQDSATDPARSFNLSYPAGSSCWRCAQFWPQAVLQSEADNPKEP